VPPHTPGGGDREDGAGPSDAGAGWGGGGLGVRCQGRANEGEDVGNPLGDKAGSMGSE
jgi:hypothetical protein